MTRLKSRAVRGWALAIGLAVSGTVAIAAPVFVGSFEVDDGPFWTTNPPVFSGREAAALLFGGVPTDYAISTVDNNPANINNMAWYSGWGVPGGTQFGEDFSLDVP